MKFIEYRKFWVDDLGWPDVSLGLHLCMKGRVDIHIFKWIISIGIVPIYKDNRGRLFAASNSFDIGFKQRSLNLAYITVRR